MKAHDIFIAHPETDEQVNALKTIAKAFKMKFEVSKEDPYDPQFVAKIQESRKQAKEGKTVRIELDETAQY